MIKFINSPGTNKGNAIKIIDAHNEIDGIDAEYKLICLIFQIKRKGWDFLKQELYKEDDSFYDRLVIEDSDGKICSYWFDITEFFGK